jgi:hypothetical protein
MFRFYEQLDAGVHLPLPGNRRGKDEEECRNEQ